jgi:hypothetical protein
MITELKSAAIALVLHSFLAFIRHMPKQTGPVP